MSAKPNYLAIPDISIVKFSGADAENFLQGQLTNDVSAIENQWQFTGYCNPKGRLLALFQLWKHADEFYATIDKGLTDATVKRLRMYVMRSKVKIEELTLASCVGIKNQPASSDRFSLQVDNSIHALHYGDRTLLVDLHGELQGHESTAWKSNTILAGEPCINASNTEMFVPQMVNLDLLGGINFKKGCYTGQEIVARMHYLGKLKQRMFLCNIESESDPNLVSGEKILSAGKKAGNIVCASNSEKVVLAVIRRELAQGILECDSGARLRLATEQPYSISE